MSNIQTVPRSVLILKELWKPFWEVLPRYFELLDTKTYNLAFLYKVDISCPVDVFGKSVHARASLVKCPC